jgi:hypothetical protein
LDQFHVKQALHKKHLNIGGTSRLTHLSSKIYAPVPDGTFDCHKEVETPSVPPKPTLRSDITRRKQDAKLMLYYLSVPSSVSK